MPDLPPETTCSFCGVTVADPCKVPEAADRCPLNDDREGAVEDEYCGRCNNTGEIDCDCGGDLCICGRQELPCPRCGGGA